MLTFEQIKELIEIVTRQRLQRVEIERSGFRLRIDGQDAVTPAPVARPAAAAIEPAAPQPTPIAAAAVETQEAETGEETQAEEQAATDGLHVLHSPIVGTFYGAPNPDAEPYVAVGDRVKAGQVLCIVEAMKLMNEIESDVDGVLQQIFPKNAQPVEFGEPLFVIDRGGQDT